MALPPSTALVFKPGDRLYAPMWQLVQLCSCLQTALMSVSDLLKKGEWTGLMPSYHSNKVVYFPLTAIVEMAVRNLTPTSLAIEVGPLPASLPPPEGIPNSMGRLITLTAAFAFANFYEAHSAWIKDTLGRDASKYPPCIQFARLVRNAIAQNGKIFIEKESYAGGEWNGFNYQFENNGEEIIGTTLEAADIVFLMLDTSAELDGLGAAIPD